MTQEVFPNAKIRQFIKAAESQPWYKTVTPRRYYTQQGYVPTEMHGASAGCFMYAEVEDGKSNDTLFGTALIANTLSYQHGFQYFWVTKDLCEALLSTREPEGPINDTPWPFRAFTLFLPKGAMATEKDGDLAWITIARCGRKDDSKIDPDGDDCLFLHGVSFSADGVPRDWCSFLRSLKTADDASGEQRHAVDNVSIEVAEEMSKRMGWSVKEMCTHGDVFTEPETLKAMLRLAMNVAYYMANVTASVEESSRAMTRKVRGVEVDSVWHPRWVGKAYKRSVVVTGPIAGSHASPRTHWRRGHWRNQAVGEGRIDRRRTWIQPILVMSGE